LNPAAILKSMYPEKFAELVEIVRGLSLDAPDDALERAAGELLVGLGQCASEAEAGPLAERVFRELLDKNITPDEAILAGAMMFRWRRSWKDVLY
jgi:hypothetical protein